MPYLFETNRLQIPRKPGLDRRVKLSAEQKAEIRENIESLSLNALAAKYGVSKRTVQFIKDPQKLAENKLRRKERGGSAQYYDREKHNAYMQDHRLYKKDLFEKELLERA